ncbi:TetR/AcrR family transcriptional regulator [Gordonia sp. DT30]|uniref:TetR/AcrR family transcriptional regulator n=1 Tax=Gordonia sp. DT30 TaxID=3416546 RepID=UPI003CE9CDFF
MSTSQPGERGVRGRSRQRRQKLLDATIEIMAAQGTAAVTHRAVAAAAGLPPSSTSYFFESIDELMGEAVTEAMDREVARLGELEGAVADEATSAGRLIANFADFIRHEHDPHTVAQFEIYLYASRKPDLRGRVVAIIEATRKVARRALRAGGVANPLAADAMLAMIDGFSLHRIANPDGAEVESLLLGLRALLIGLSALEVVGDTTWDARQPPEISTDPDTPGS